MSFPSVLSNRILGACERNGLTNYVSLTEECFADRAEYVAHVARAVPDGAFGP